MNYYAVELTGLLDMRSVAGPFADIALARAKSEDMNAAPCRGRFIPDEKLFVAMNEGYANGPFRTDASLRADMKEAQDDSTIGAGQSSMAGEIVEMLIGLHQSFGAQDSVTAVVKVL